MVQKIKLMDNNYFETLEDCETSLIEFSNNKLIFTFTKEDLSNIFIKKKIIQLQVTFLLNDNFLDDIYIPAVRQIRQNKYFKKTVLKYFTLKNFVDDITINKLKIKFYSEYFNQNKCLLIVGLTKKNFWDIENEYNLELLVDEIIYDWKSEI